MTAPKLTTREGVDQEIVECWRLLKKADEACRRLILNANGEHNEAWVDAADDLLAARHVVSMRGRVMPEGLPPVDEGSERSCVDLTRELVSRFQAIPLELEPSLWPLAVVHVADAVRAVEKAARLSLVNQ